MRCLLLLVLAGSLLLPACGAKPRKASPSKAGLEQLSDYMTGLFSSEAQSKKQKGYFDIRLAMARIWRDRTDGIWLYVEQAMAGRAPYRQRVYRVTHVGGDLYESEVYELPGDPKDFAGAHEQDAPLSDLGPADLSEKPGCAVLLRRMSDGSFAGATLGSQCASTFGGADHATSEVRVTKDRLVSWDRGFNAKHEQVWGATEGGYIFDKLEDLTP